MAPNPEGTTAALTTALPQYHPAHPGHAKLAAALGVQLPPAPPQVRSCSSCKHGLSCRVGSDCLGRGPGFAYKHYEEGDAVAELLRLQLAGEHAIAIDGEAQVYANETADNSHASLCAVAEACGYSVLRDGPSIYVTTHGGMWRVLFDAVGVVRIRRQLRDGTSYDQWNRTGILDPENADKLVASLKTLHTAAKRVRDGLDAGEHPGKFASILDAAITHAKGVE